MEQRTVAQTAEEFFRAYPDTMKVLYLGLRLHLHGRKVKDLMVRVEGVKEPLGGIAWWNEAQRRAFEAGAWDIENQKLLDAARMDAVLKEIEAEWLSGRATWNNAGA